MRKFLSRGVLLAFVLGVGGCASIDDVKKAQATADQALSAAQGAQQTASAAQQAASTAQQTANAADAAAKTAQQSSDQNRSELTSLGQQVQDLQAAATRKKGQRD